MIADTFSGYTIIGKIGGGNTGIVYKAVDPKTGEFLALKILPNDFLVSNEKRARFQREAKAAKLLSHAAIAKMLHIGEHGGHNFIAMEYVDGKSFAQVIDAYPDGLPFQHFYRLVLPVLDGVAYAHEQNLVHRDLKPENIKVSSSRQPKVLDFGLVKFLDKDPNSSGEDSFQTMAGMVLGSAGYMSPEQAEGLSFDARTDVFSLGIIMYEMLTGKNPFASKSPFATIAKILSSNPLSIELLRPDIPMDLSKAIFTCLSKDMNDRFPNARAVFRAVSEIKGS